MTKNHSAVLLLNLISVVRKNRSSLVFLPVPSEFMEQLERHGCAVVHSAQFEIENIKSKSEHYFIFDTTILISASAMDAILLKS